MSFLLQTLFPQKIATKLVKIFRMKNILGHFFFVFSGIIYPWNSIFSIPVLSNLLFVSFEYEHLKEFIC